MPKVSVIIPVYGVEKYIERCARSLFEQTLDDIEYLFIDDCTQDNSIQILDAVLKEYPNCITQVTILHHEINKGLPLARQTGIHAATGEYIAHCDSDDWVEPDMYQLMYEKAISENADVVISGIIYSDNKGRHRSKSQMFSQDDDVLYKVLTHELQPCVWNKLTKRTLYDDSIIYPKDNMGEDIALMSQIIYKAKKCACVDKCLYHYYTNDESISRKRDKESCIRKWNQTRRNTEVVLNLIYSHSLEKKYDYPILILKEEARDNNLLPMVDDTEVRRLWLSVYPKAHRQRLFGKYFSFKLLLRYIAVYFGFYRIINKQRIKRANR